MIAERVRDSAAVSGTAYRDAHPKMHGCVEAEFHVLDDLPAELKVGLFAQARRYPAWVRFSNGAGKPQPDSVADARGAAIKLMGVEGSRSGTQDFVLINSPRFFVRNAADYVALQNVGDNQIRFFFPGLNPFRWRLHELFAALAITRQTVSNPLNIQYWSMSPYLLGETACKFTLRPAGAASAVQRSIDAGFPARQPRQVAGADGRRPSTSAFRFAAEPTMPIEDPTIAWSEADAPFVPVARLVIPRQSFDTPERRAFGEALSFTPWHGLDAHRPLGGINRARRVVYETISGLRHAIDHTPRQEPVA